MTDLALAFNSDANAADLCITDGDLALDDGLSSLALATILTDARADGIEMEAGDDDRRGWWGDALEPTRPWGGKMWLIAREKMTPEIMRRARDYAAEHFQGFVEDGLAEAVTVSTERIDGVGDSSTLALRVEIHRPTGELVRLLFDNLWRATA